MSNWHELLGLPDDYVMHKTICGWCGDGLCADNPEQCVAWMCDCTHETDDEDS